MGVSVVIDSSIDTLVDNDSATAFKIMMIYDGVVVNNAPTFTSPIEIIVNADTTYTFDPAVIIAAMTDVEADLLDKVKVIEAISKGTMTYGIPVLANVINNDVLSWANFNLLKFTPIAGQSGYSYAKLTLQFRDDGENPKCWSDDVVIIFHVLGDNMEPTVSDHEIEVAHASTTTLTTAYFTQNYYDPELDPLGHIVIHNVPSGNIGSLLFASVALTWADMPKTITAAELLAGDLEFVDLGHFITAKTFNLSFTVYDNVP
tara:strand:- start:72228 stop:73007 length:780 start_codon:yes stop_codon:yes gene_type:complete